MKQRYLFLYINTGGGHLAPARSVAEKIQQDHPDIEPVLIDGLKESPPFIRRTIEDGYRFLQSRARWWYAVIYFTNKLSPISRLNEIIVSHFAKPYLERMIREHRPEKIVIFHFMMIRPVREILEKRGLKTHTLVVVTDPYTVHPVWHRDRTQNFVVFSEKVKTAFIAHGVPESHVAVFPFVIDKKFSTPMPPERIPALREQLRFDPGRKMVLVVGGRDGMPRGVKIVKALLRSGGDFDIVAVCGNNRELLSDLMRLQKRMNARNLTVYGFASNMYELLQAADIVVSKCGASMFMEILLSRKIPFINSYLWEQEKGNVEFICESGIGFYEPDVRLMAKKVNALILAPQLLDAIHDKISAMGITNGTEQVAQYIFEFAPAEHAMDSVSTNRNGQ